MVFVHFPALEIRRKRKKDKLLKNCVLNSMKKIPLFIFLFALFVSCTPGEGIIEDITKGLVKTPPALLSWGVDESNSFFVSFSETVEVNEIKAEGTLLLKEKLGSSFSIPLPFVLLPGEKASIMMTISDTNGNKERFSFSIKGKNRHIPSLLINEVSIKGTQSNPDRIELYVIKEGDTAGITVSDDKYSFSLPSISVKEGDLILIYWDRKTTKKNWERNRGKMTYVLNAGASSTLSGTEGIVIIRKEEKGDIMDALFYSEKGEDAFKEGEKKKQYDEAISSGQWNGGVFDSALVTSSRVISRLPGAVDTDTYDDYFITAPRRSTFGEENEFVPYQGV